MLTAAPRCRSFFGRSRYSVARRVPRHHPADRTCLPRAASSHRAVWRHWSTRPALPLNAILKIGATSSPNASGRPGRPSRISSGYAARYMGDGVLAYFGWPNASEDAAERAVRAGLTIVDAFASLNRRLMGTTGSELAVRVGIHSGWASGYRQPRHQQGRDIRRHAECRLARSGKVRPEC